MKYQPQSKNTISPEDLDRFIEYLHWAELHSDNLKGGEVDFVTSMTEKYEKFGSKLFVSQAQFDWLEKIAARVG